MSNRNNNRQNRKRRQEKARKSHNKAKSRVEQMTKWDEVLLHTAASACMKTPYGQNADELPMKITHTQRINGKNYLIVYSEEFELQKGDLVWSSDTDFGGVQLFELAVSLPRPNTNRGGFYIIGTHDGDKRDKAHFKWCYEAADELMVPTMLANGDYFYEAVQEMRIRIQFNSIVSEFEKIYK